MARVEPRARSIPSSRVRSRTVIERALKTRKAPTKSEVPAKKSSAILNPWSWPLTCRVRVSDARPANPRRVFCPVSPRGPRRRRLPRPRRRYRRSGPACRRPPGRRAKAPCRKPRPPKDPPGIRKSPTSSNSLRSFWSSDRDRVPDPEPRALGRSPVEGSSLPLRGKCPSVSSKPVASSADRGSTPKRRMLLTSGKSFFFFFEDERGRERIAGRGRPYPFVAAHLSRPSSGRTRRCPPPP